MNELREALFDVAFKRTLRELDDLCDLALQGSGEDDPENQRHGLLRAARQLVLDTRPRPAPALNSPRALDVAERSEALKGDIGNQQENCKSSVKEEGLTYQCLSCFQPVEPGTRHITHGKWVVCDVVEDAAPASATDIPYPNAIDIATSFADFAWMEAVNDRAKAKTERVSTDIPSHPKGPEMDFTGEWITQDGTHYFYNKRKLY